MALGRGATGIHLRNFFLSFHWYQRGLENTYRGFFCFFYTNNSLILKELVQFTYNSISIAQKTRQNQADQPLRVVSVSMMDCCFDKQGKAVLFFYRRKVFRKTDISAFSFC